MFFWVAVKPNWYFWAARKFLDITPCMRMCWVPPWGYFPLASLNPLKRGVCLGGTPGFSRSVSAAWVTRNHIAFHISSFQHFIVEIAPFSLQLVHNTRLPHMNPRLIAVRQHRVGWYRIRVNYTRWNAEWSESNRFSLHFQRKVTSLRENGM